MTIHHHTHKIAIRLITESLKEFPHTLRLCYDNTNCYIYHTFNYHEALVSIITITSSQLIHIIFTNNMDETITCINYNDNQICDKIFNTTLEGYTVYSLQSFIKPIMENK